MQKIRIALIFALILGCVAANYTINPAGWVKQPVKVLEDTDYNFTNLTTLMLSTVNSTTDLNVIAFTQSESNSSSASWNLSTKAITAKDLSPSSVASYGFKASKTTPWFSRGYAFGIDCSQDFSFLPPQWYLYQTKLDGAVELPRVQLTSNTKVYQTPIINTIIIGNNIVIFINYGPTINFTSYNIETFTLGEEFTLTTFATFEFNLAWGKALSDSQVYVGWKGSDFYRVAIVDFSTGIMSNSKIVAGYQKSMFCVPYATDLKLYGVWCRNETSDGSTTNLTILVSSTDATLRNLFTVVNESEYYGIIGGIPYGGHLGFIHYIPTSPNATTIAKEIWDLEANKPFLNKTTIMTYDLYLSAQSRLRIPGVGTYQLVYNINNTNGMKSAAVLGQIFDEPASEKWTLGDSDIADFLPLLE